MTAMKRNSRSFSNGAKLEQEMNSLSIEKQKSSMADFRELEEVKAVNEMLYTTKNGNDDSTSNNESTIDTSLNENYNEDFDDQDFLFYDIESNYEILVPTKTGDTTEEKSTVTENTKPLKKVSSMVDLDAIGHVKVEKRRSLLKRSSSYGAVNDLDEKTNPNMKRNVSFTSLEVREYEITLGDHPAVSNGPPIGLSWSYNEAERVDLDLFEATRGPRRSRHQMVMGSNLRRKILRDSAGFSNSEIKNATMEALKIKKSRVKSVSKMNPTKIEEAFASALKKVKKVIPGKSRR